jgi:hypothetical protein
VHCVLLVAVLQCFRVPLVRQLYWWWGIRPITRHSMRRLLHKGRCVVLVPGGVQVGGGTATLTVVSLCWVCLSKDGNCVVRSLVACECGWFVVRCHHNGATHACVR